MAAVINSIRARLRLVRQTSARPVPSPRLAPSQTCRLINANGRSHLRGTTFSFIVASDGVEEDGVEECVLAAAAGLIRVGCPSQTSRNVDLCLQSANLFFGRQIFIISASLPLHFNKSVILPRLITSLLSLAHAPQSRWPAVGK